MQVKTRTRRCQCKHARVLSYHDRISKVALIGLHRTAICKFGQQAKISANDLRRTSFDDSLVPDEKSFRRNSAVNISCRC